MQTQQAASVGRGKKNTERKNKKTKEEKKSKGEQQKGFALPIPWGGGGVLGFTCYNLLGNWRFCVKWFCVMGIVTFQFCKRTKERS